MIYTPVTTDSMPDVQMGDVALAYLRADESERSQIDLLLKAGQLYAEQWCDQPLFAREYTLPIPGYVNARLIGVNVTGVKVFGSADLETQLENTDLLPLYSLNGAGVLTWNSRVYAGGFAPFGKLTYRAGYEIADTPEDLKLALLAFLADRYDNRGNSVAERITMVDRLLQPYKRYA